MINGVGNFLAFADNNISSSNSLEIINDNSFAEMLNKIQKEDIYSESSTNKIVDRDDYKNYDNYDNVENNNNDFQKYLETMDNDKVEEFNNNLENQNDSKQIKNNKEENKIDNEKLENSFEDKKTENAENNAIKENSNDLNSDKEKIETLKSLKEKAKNIIENIEKNNLLVKDLKADKNAEKLSSSFLNMTKEEKENLIKEINDLNKEIKKLESKELNENEKEDLLNLFESLENLKNIILENTKEKSENIKENKELQIKNLEEKNIKELKENLKETELNNNLENIEETDLEYNFDLEDNIQSNKRENKTENLNNNSNNNLNNTISDDKGAEITIINMKDSPEGANLKGFNHYNNVSKTQSGNNLTENMIKFQDLMGKLVEKAQVAINNGKSEVLMSLNPEYLGKVRLKISMEGDNFVGKIFVDNAEIKDIFTKNLDTVITSLNEIGINIEGFDVMLRQDMPDNEEFSEFADNNSFGRFGGGDFAEETVADIRNYIVPERKLNLLI